jgi:hypothetical protein
MNHLPVHWSPARINIYLACTEESLALPEITADPEVYNDWECEVGLEEIFCSANTTCANGRESGIELLRINIDTWVIG